MKFQLIKANKTATLEKNSTLLNRILFHKYFYIMLIPVLVWYLIFTYFPMYGVMLAFKSYNFKGILASPWVGLENFKDLMGDPSFWTAFRNTIIISFGKLVFTFPAPIIFAILISEVSRNKLRRVYQTIFTFPHFISWVVLSGIIINIFSQAGLYNQFVQALGGKQTALLVDTEFFRPMLYVTHIWKEIGWDSIIYLAALAGINPEIYEAASIDGANRFQRIIHITWPGISSTVAILFILAIGGVMNGGGFDQIFNLYSAPVYSVADTIDTYVYRGSFSAGMDFGYTTAVGLVKSIINLFMLYMANTLVRKFGESSLF